MSHAKSAAACIFFAIICLPGAATTLVRCKIDKKVVYSDTDCADKGKARSAFSPSPASKPITIRFPRKKAASGATSRKKQNRNALVAR